MDEFAKLEIYLHAMAPGFVDGLTSVESACTWGTAGAFDFSFESLCFQAFGGRWLTTLASVPTDLVPAGDVRPDRPQGFGPLPNTIATAEVFNQFAAAVNLLDTVRVMLPAKLETRQATRHHEYVVDPYNAAGNLVSVSGVPSSSFGSEYAVWIDTVPVGSGAWTWGAWEDANDVFAGTRQATMREPGLEEWSIVVDELIMEWRWTFLDPDAIEAIPESWQANLTDNGAVLAIREILVAPERRVYVPIDTGRQCHDGLIPSDTVWNGAPGGRALEWVTNGTPTVTCGGIPITGQLVAPPLPYSSIWASDMVSTNPDNYCASGPVTSDQLTPINKQTIIITIPPVEPPTD
jgi:hypothetical protein